jgi:hypothetical protein
MKRREFIAGLGAVTWPLTVRAQQGDRVRRVGVLIPGDENDPETKARISAFTQALAAWVGPKAATCRWTLDGAAMTPIGYEGSRRSSRIGTCAPRALSISRRSPLKPTDILLQPVEAVRDFSELGVHHIEACITP